jgi:hypothetical protein
MKTKRTKLQSVTDPAKIAGVYKSLMDYIKIENITEIQTSVEKIDITPPDGEWAEYKHGKKYLTFVLR